jgi:hypothetical protein
MTTTMLETAMPTGERRGMPIRISDEALAAARIAAAFEGISIMEYVSRVVLARAEEDIRKGYEQRAQKPPPPRPEHPKPGTKGK